MFKSEVKTHDSLEKIVDAGKTTASMCMLCSPVPPGGTTYQVMLEISNIVSVLPSTAGPCKETSPLFFL